jgi:hypothetical protein
MQPANFVQRRMFLSNKKKTFMTYDQKMMRGLFIKNKSAKMRKINAH